ncbi:MAG: GNAT family N-acetyltransferase [Chloroflexota bacterium]|nr:GNAT family N-acetyltransferase [Chloroflexota bacterium]
MKVGERVYLRLVEVADAQSFADASHLEGEPELQDDGRVPVSVIAHERWIRDLGARGTPEELSFAICRIDDDACIGGTTLRHIDWINRTAETGTGLLAAAERGQGIGTEAKHLLLEYGFLDLGLHALNSMVYEHNTRSIAALEKQGYRLAGRLTADVQRGGAFHDTLLFDVTREDWERAGERWRSNRADIP